MEGPHGGVAGFGGTVGCEHGSRAAPDPEGRGEGALRGQHERPF